MAMTVSVAVSRITQQSGSEVRTGRASLGAFLALAALTGCTPLSEPAPTTVPSPAPSTDYPPNPIDTITDPSSGLFVDFTVDPVLDETGSGPATFELPEVDGKVAFYVTCSPTAEYRIDVFDSFVSGDCGDVLAAFGTVPVSSESRTVRLSVPDGAMFHIVGVEQGK